MVVWQDGPDAPPIRVTNPADGSIVAEVDKHSAQLAEAAVDAADSAFPAWAGLLPQERSQLLRRWWELIILNKEDLARIITLEQGKPISESRGEISYAASFVEFYAEETKRPNIEGVTSHLPDAEVEVWLEPVGVCALITPWNFPSAMLTRKAAAALAAGCTVVAHPSQETPLSAIALAVLAEEAGFPPGVFNLVCGDAASIVEPWLIATKVRALSFTGSTEIGRMLYGRSASTVKRLVLELGGHAPFLVFEDADLNRAVAESINAKFATTGQDCLGANRFLVHRSIYESFCHRMVIATKNLSIGPGLEDPDIGPLIHERAVNKQQAQVADALGKGARLLLGGNQHQLGPLYYEPTVLVDVPADADIMHEETFGPVVAICPFDDEDEALSLANDTEYGLIAYLHTQDPRRIYRLSRGLEFGMVAVNRTKVTGAPIPFGGRKQSGIGREGARLGMEAFMDVKYVCRDWSQSERSNECKTEEIA